MIAREGDLVVRLMAGTEADFQLMARWMSDPEVLIYYGGRDKPLGVDQIAEEFGPRALGEEDVTPCIIEFEGRPIGYVQFFPLQSETLAEYEMDQSDSPHGFDIFIGEPELWGHGLGARAVSLVAHYLFGLGAGIVTADPRVTNPRAVRVYEKAGLKIVRRLPAHELHEGERHDCWLMAAYRR